MEDTKENLERRIKSLKRKQYTWLGLSMLSLALTFASILLPLKKIDEKDFQIPPRYYSAHYAIQYFQQRGGCQQIIEDIKRDITAIESSREYQDYYKYQRELMGEEGKVYTHFFIPIVIGGILTAGCGVKSKSYLYQIRDLEKKLS